MPWLRQGTITGARRGVAGGAGGHAGCGRAGAVRGGGGAAIWDRGRARHAAGRGPGRHGHVGVRRAEHRPALDRVAQLTATMKQGERAGAGLTQREAEREQERQRRSMRF